MNIVNLLNYMILWFVVSTNCLIHKHIMLLFFVCNLITTITLVFHLTYCYIDSSPTTYLQLGTWSVEHESIWAQLYQNNVPALLCTSN